jgi:hypothetical protein
MSEFNPREHLKSIDLENVGFLEGLSGGIRETTKHYMLRVDYNRPKMTETIESILPVVRRIISLILDTDDQMYMFKEKPELKTEVIGLLNTNDMIDGLDVMYSEVLPIIDKHFPKLDGQAELTLLFSYNYVYDLVSLIKKD